jgi:hypothetical protein
MTLHSTVWHGFVRVIELAYFQTLRREVYEILFYRVVAYATGVCRQRIRFVGTGTLPLRKHAFSFSVRLEVRPVRKFVPTDPRVLVALIVRTVVLILKVTHLERCTGREHEHFVGCAPDRA